MTKKVYVVAVLVGIVLNIGFSAILIWAGVPWLMRTVVQCLVAFLVGLELARNHERYGL